MYHSLPIHVSIYSTFVAENFKRHCSFMALYGKKFFETHLRKKIPNKKFLKKSYFLPDRESNPGLPRDRRRSSPLDYRGIDTTQRIWLNLNTY